MQEKPVAGMSFKNCSVHQISNSISKLNHDMRVANFGLEKGKKILLLAATLLEDYSI